MLKNDCDNFAKGELFAYIELLSSHLRVTSKYILHLHRLSNTCSRLSTMQVVLKLQHFI